MLQPLNLSWKRDGKEQPQRSVPPFIPPCKHCSGVSLPASSGDGDLKGQKEVQDGEKSPEHAQHFGLKRSNLTFPMPVHRKGTVRGGDLEIPRNSEEFPQQFVVLRRRVFPL